jgi:hypothetical protein
MHLIVGSLLVGVALIYLGFSSRGFAFIAVWLGVNFLLTAVAYASKSARIYGKNTSGRFALWAQLLYLPFFLYTLIIWHIVQRLINEHAYDWITESIIIGRRLVHPEYPVGVVNYVDLTAEFSEPKALIGRLNYISLPILDGGVPDKKALLTAMDKLLAGVTYIHCAQGHGRSGLFAALLLLKQGQVSTIEEALILLKNKRPKLTLTKAQNVFVRTFDWSHRYK